MNLSVASKRTSLFTASLLLAAIFSSGSIASAAAQQPRVADGFSTDWANLKIDVRELAPHVYLLHGSGGNTVASIGPDGTLLVDSEFAQVAPKLAAALQKLGAGPVRYIVSTHYHSDHTGANAAFHKDGAVIVAQENCRLRMMQTQFSQFWNRSSPPAPAESLPTLTFDRKLTLFLNGEEIEAFHNQPAHTDGDAIVYFHHANVIHMGDVFVNNLYPYIDLGAKGRIDGYFPVIDEVLERIDDQTQVVPGHGPIATKQELKSYRDMLHTIRDRVAAQIAQNKSLEEILASHPTREFDRQYATDRVGGGGFTAMVYQSLTGKRLDWHPAS
ncbi:MBL fold metallo-hydrolase [Granulicella mallensis]|uniref:Glyoxylase-like metal-dependent hydrolase (Beta-lactamase superfamily II) n=1 Tax=Granulicella mallensis TaxID=940614 RepID=A0A7W7ZMU2_9BACT|nr:MBL fold metallo-hydrolase [Granulicella mallensis]MBB5062850.1 glyoxylase-like metal-dependent hydrolase (beta-lactamase superfamily II) [Granulicella mallensis]